MSIRKVTLADADWLHEVAEHAYPAGTYDRQDAERWMTAIIGSDDYLVLRGENAFITVGLMRLPYNRKVIEAYFLPVASLGNGGRQLLVMVSRAISWARERKASRFIFGAVQSPRGTDLKALAECFNAEPACANYVLEL